MQIPPKKTMVCVTVQKTCERLIKEGAAISGDEGLSVVHVVRNGGSVLGGESDAEALDYLFSVSRTYGAEMDMLRSDEVIATIVDFAVKHKIEYLVVGGPAGRSERDVGAQLRARLPQVRIFVVPSMG